MTWQAELVQGTQRHHIIPVATLKAWHRTQTRNAQLTGAHVPSLKALLEDPRNQMGLETGRHMNHTHGPRGRLTRSELPESVEDFATEHGLENILDRYYA